MKTSILALLLLNCSVGVLGEEENKNLRGNVRIHNNLEKSQVTDNHSDIRRNLVADTAGWKKVRHVQAGYKWHPATDQLAGTDVYGTHGGNNNWSINFEQAVPGYDEFLFSTGDKEKWLITAKDQVLGYYINQPRTIIKSSTSDGQYKAKWYRRTGRLEDPWISLSDHGTVVGNVMYGEDSYGGGHASGVLPSNKNNGADVYIRKKHTPSENPSSSSSSLPSDSPTTKFQGEDYDFKSMESKFVDDMINGFVIELNYTLGKSVNKLNVTLLDKNCTDHTVDNIINIVTGYSVDGNGHFLKKVNVDKQKMSTSKLVTRSEGSSKGILSFCIKAEGISEDNISVSFQQDQLNLSYDLTKNTFEVLSNGLKVDDIDTTSKSVTTSYSIIADRCNSSTYEAIAQDTPLQQNDIVFICIEPNSTDVEISMFDLNFVQDDSYMFKVVREGKKSSDLSSVSTDGDKIKIASRLVSALFDNDKDTFTASGNADLTFKIANRKLESLRILSSKDNAGEASFGMNVKLQKKIAAQKESHNIPKITVSVLGTCVLLSVLFIAIKKMKGLV